MCLNVISITVIKFQIVTRTYHIIILNRLYQLWENWKKTRRKKWEIWMYNTSKLWYCDDSVDDDDDKSGECCRSSPLVYNLIRNEHEINDFGLLIAMLLFIYALMIPNSSHITSSFTFNWMLLVNSPIERKFNLKTSTPFGGLIMQSVHITITSVFYSYSLSSSSWIWRYLTLFICIMLLLQKQHISNK